MINNGKAIKINILDGLKKSTVTKEMAKELEKGEPFITEMTPDMAEIILSVSNTFNRAPSNVKIKSYATSMMNGDWQYNGDPIRFYKDDYKLADGQHRLQAMVQTKTSHKTLIVPNIDHEAYLTIDTGKGRTPRDCFMMMNHSNPSEKSTCATLALKWTITKRLAGSAVPSTIQILAFEGTHTLAVSEACRYAVALQEEYGRVIAPGSLAAALVIDYLSRGELDTEFMQFCENFWAKTVEATDSPAYQLVRIIDRHLQSKTIKQGKLNTEMLVATILRAWKLQRTGKIATTFNDIIFPARKNEPFSAVL